jgi:23S rRNA (adenine2503-C2)-methyltransferase
MLTVVQSEGTDDLARVFVGRLGDGRLIEFVESVQPPIPRDQKWVLIVSTLHGCPVNCPICDAGGAYGGRLTAEEIIAQVDYLVRRRHPDGRCTIPKLKVQFARMGDPAFNDAVLDAIEEIPSRLDMPGFLPSISTVAPASRERFFERLIALKKSRFPGGRFQMQLSLHTTDQMARKALVPVRTWSFEEMASFGERFWEDGDRKIALNFAAPAGYPLDPESIRPIFSPDRFLIKLTPINPTRSAERSGLVGVIDPSDPERCRAIGERFRAAGYETIISIGELEENAIGSNCGMYALAQAQGHSATRCSPQTSLEGLGRPSESTPAPPSWFPSAGTNK